MSNELLIQAGLLLPLAIFVGIYLTGRAQNIREAVTLTGSAALFAVIVAITCRVANGDTPALKKKIEREEHQTREKE